MTYQKPINPQRFDQPVYEQLRPKKKTESKRVFAKQHEPGLTQGRARGKKPVAAKTRSRAIVKSKSK